MAVVFVVAILVSFGLFVSGQVTGAGTVVDNCVQGSPRTPAPDCVPVAEDDRLGEVDAS